MKKSELKDKTIDELRSFLKDLSEEKRNIRFNEVLSSVSNPARIKFVRKDIARVKTMIRKYELDKLGDK